VHGEADGTPQATGIDSRNISEIFMHQAARLFEGKNVDPLYEPFLRATATEIMQAVLDGYGKNPITADFDTIDTDTLRHLQENVWYFSAAKNYQELLSLQNALKDGSRIRSFNEFERIARQLDDTYNSRWLRAEHRHAIAASQAAARWNDFVRDKDDVQNLRYEAVMDMNTRPEHADLNGVVKPVDDPFWDTFMPPNGHGCRCEAVQAAGSKYKVTPDKNIRKPSVSELFRRNFGKDRIVYPPKHPYHKLPKEYAKEARTEAQKQVKRYFDNLAQYKVMKEAGEYHEMKFDITGGGLQATHELHSLNNRRGTLYELYAQKIGYKNGNAVVLGPEIGSVGKVADGTWNGKKADIRGIETGTSGNILNGIEHCAKKPNTKTAVLVFPNGNFNENNFNQALKRYKGVKDKKGYKINEVVVIAGKDLNDMTPTIKKADL
jgi:SPP1 gp7 family putative phage head morphogenesis protein